MPPSCLALCGARGLCLRRLVEMESVCVEEQDGAEGGQVPEGSGESGESSHFAILLDSGSKITDGYFLLQYLWGLFVVDLCGDGGGMRSVCAVNGRSELTVLWRPCPVPGRRRHVHASDEVNEDCARSPADAYGPFSEAT